PADPLEHPLQTLLPPGPFISFPHRGKLCRPALSPSPSPIWPTSIGPTHAHVHARTLSHRLVHAPMRLPRRAGCPVLVLVLVLVLAPEPQPCREGCPVPVLVLVHDPVR